VQAIVEHKDASAASSAIREVYSGIMAVPTRLLKRWLARLTTRQRPGRVLPDRHREASPWPTACAVVAHQITDAGAGGRRQQPGAAGGARARLPAAAGRALMEQGVRLADPARFDLRGTLAAGRTSRSTSTACSKAR
jgi:bifunctional UDP-N-acetylglucosamine pyrophosphorylase/glucosamine-1-phosphate N-acetyltransferase